MENLLSTEAIPDGYKLVLEEDTGIHIIHFHDQYIFFVRLGCKNYH